MSASDAIKAELQKARDELRDVASEARGAASELKDDTAKRFSSAKAKRDTLRGKVHHDLYTQLQSLDAEKATLDASIRGQSGAARAKTQERVQEVEKKIGVARDELAAHADLTVDEIDDEIDTLEASSKGSQAEARQKADNALSDLKSRRDQLRDKAAALRVAAGDRLRQASAEFNKDMEELTEKRNQGYVGVN